MSAVRARVVTLLVVLVAAAAVVAVAIAASRAGTEEAVDAPAAERLLDGIPQDGAWLGAPDAPVVVEEYADLQCPFCAVAARDAVPPVIREGVRSGQVRLRFRTLAFLGPDSVEAGRAAVAAGAQDRQWGFVERFYARQGAENSGYVDEAFLREVAAEVPGLDADRMLADAAAPATERVLAADTAAARRAGVQGTPTFLVGRRGGPLTPAPGASADDLRAAIDRARAGT